MIALAGFPAVESVAQSFGKFRKKAIRKFATAIGNSYRKIDFFVAICDKTPLKATPGDMSLVIQGHCKRGGARVICLW